MGHAPRFAKTRENRRKSHGYTAGRGKTRKRLLAATRFRRRFTWACCRGIPGLPPLRGWSIREGAVPSMCLVYGLGWGNRAIVVYVVYPGCHGYRLLPRCFPGAGLARVHVFVLGGCHGCHVVRGIGRARLVRGRLRKKTRKNVLKRCGFSLRGAGQVCYARGRKAPLT